MTTADELIDRGELTAAVDALGDSLRRNPRDPGRCAMLFTTLCLTGQLERAGRQLDALEATGEKASPGILDPSFYRRSWKPSCFASVTLPTACAEDVRYSRRSRRARLFRSAGSLARQSTTRPVSSSTDLKETDLRVPAA